ncbi:MAG: MBL fold metallo-hydrolase [Armatimonadetes bacterium]|nr:MBL fold metallo-hydrolase [Armatimonadota bacterium]
MDIHFWGTRGSLPGSITEKTIKEKIDNALKKSLQYKLKDDSEIENFINEKLTFSERGTFGNNTSCVEIKDNDLNSKEPNEYIICDAGSGLRDFGNSVLKSGKIGIFHLFISHFHWDHIQGFPFFIPAFIPGNTVNIYGCHQDMEQAFIFQQSSRHFPLPLKEMKGNIKFKLLNPENEYNIAGFQIKIIKQNHPGVSYGYSFEKDGKKVVYSTDAEHDKNAESKNYPFLDFFRNADILIFDAQYILVHNMDLKKDWGHSSNIIGVELAVKTGVKRLCLFHNEHAYDDEILEKLLRDTRRYLKICNDSYPLEIDLAYDGLELMI